MDVCLTLFLTIDEGIDFGFLSMHRVLCLDCDGVPNTVVVSLSSDVILFFVLDLAVSSVSSFLCRFFSFAILLSSLIICVSSFRLFAVPSSSRFPDIMFDLPISFCFFDFSAKTFKACFRCLLLAFSATWIATCLTVFLLNVFSGFIDNIRKNSLLCLFDPSNFPSFSQMRLTSS